MIEQANEVAEYAVEEVTYSSILTKNTTDKELREMEKEFSDEKYKLKISKVKRNKKGEIIEIKLEFDSGKTYNRILERKSTEPIDDIKIFINSDKDDDNSCGFEEVSNVVSVKYVEDEETVEVKKDTYEYTIDNMVKNGKKVNLIINEEIESYVEWLEGASLRAFLAEFSALLARDRREGGFFGGIHGSFGQRGHANAC